MELAKNNGCGLAQTSTSVMNGVDMWQPVHRRSKYLTVRIRKIECVLADIQFQIERLQREKAYLGLVRAELGGRFTRVHHKIKHQRLEGAQHITAPDQ